MTDKQIQRILRKKLVYMRNTEHARQALRTLRLYARLNPANRARIAWLESYIAEREAK